MAVASVRMLANPYSTAGMCETGPGPEAAALLMVFVQGQGRGLALGTRSYTCNNNIIYMCVLLSQGSPFAEGLDITSFPKMLRTLVLTGEPS